MTDIIDAKIWELHIRIVNKRNTIVENFLDLGRDLLELKQQRGYEQLGHPSFEGYLADPDVDITKSTAYRAMRVYEAFSVPPMEHTQLVLVGVTKLDMIRPYIGQGDREELLNNALTLSRSDLEIELRELFGDEQPVERYFDREVKRLKNYLWNIQEIANGRQKELLAQAYQLIQEAEALAAG